MDCPPIVLFFLNFNHSLLSLLFYIDYLLLLNNSWYIYLRPHGFSRDVLPLVGNLLCVWVKDRRPWGLGNLPGQSRLSSIAINPLNHPPTPQLSTDTFIPPSVVPPILPIHLRQHLQ
jgi:hypothetical protein